MNESTHKHDHHLIPPPRGYRIMHAVMCPMMKLFGLSCRQFAELTSTRMDRPLTRLEALRFQFHRSMCGLCRHLPVQLERLRELIRCAACEDQGPPDETATPSGGLRDDALERIREALRDEETGSSP